MALRPTTSTGGAAPNPAGGDNRHVARMAALLAGLPETVPGATVNRLCAFGLEAVTTNPARRRPHRPPP